jgi:hypothetical protein
MGIIMSGDFNADEVIAKIGNAITIQNMQQS